MCFVIKVVFPTSIYQFLKLPHRHDLRLVYMVILNPIKLIIKINHQNVARKKTIVIKWMWLQAETMVYVRAWRIMEMRYLTFCWDCGLLVYKFCLRGNPNCLMCSTKSFMDTFRSIYWASFLIALISSTYKYRLQNPFSLLPFSYFRAS